MTKAQEVYEVIQSGNGGDEDYFVVSKFDGKIVKKTRTAEEAVKVSNRLNTAVRVASDACYKASAAHRQLSQSENERLLQWALDQIRMCQEEKFYGKMTIIMEGGKIVRRTTESSEVPPKSR